MLFKSSEFTKLPQAVTGAAPLAVNATTLPVKGAAKSDATALPTGPSSNGHTAPMVSFAKSSLLCTLACFVLTKEFEHFNSSQAATVANPAPQGGSPPSH